MTGEHQVENPAERFFCLVFFKSAFDSVSLSISFRINIVCDRSQFACQTNAFVSGSSITVTSDLYFIECMLTKLIWDRGTTDTTQDWHKIYMLHQVTMVKQQQTSLLSLSLRYQYRKVTVFFTFGFLGSQKRETDDEIFISAIAVKILMWFVTSYSSYNKTLQMPKMSHSFIVQTFCEAAY